MFLSNLLCNDAGPNLFFRILRSHFWRVLPSQTADLIPLWRTWENLRIARMEPRLPCPICYVVMMTELAFSYSAVTFLARLIII